MPKYVLFSGGTEQSVKDSAPLDNDFSLWKCLLMVLFEPGVVVVLHEGTCQRAIYVYVIDIVPVALIYIISSCHMVLVRWSDPSHFLSSSPHLRLCH